MLVMNLSSSLVLTFSPRPDAGTVNKYQSILSIFDDRLIAAYMGTIGK